MHWKEQINARILKLYVVLKKNRTPVLMIFHDNIINEFFQPTCVITDTIREYNIICLKI